MLYEIYEETGEMPKALLDRPVLSERWVYSKDVFDGLSGSRNYSMNGPLPIPVSEFSAYAAGYGFTKSEWLETYEDLLLIDAIWLDEVSKRQEKKGA